MLGLGGARLCVGAGPLGATAPVSPALCRPALAAPQRRLRLHPRLLALTGPRGPRVTRGKAAARTGPAADARCGSCARLAAASTRDGRLAGSATHRAAG